MRIKKSDFLSAERSEGLALQLKAGTKSGKKAGGKSKNART